MTAEEIIGFKRKQNAKIGIHKYKEITISQLSVTGFAVRCFLP